MSEKNFEDRQGFLPTDLSERKIFDFQRKIRDLEIQVIDMKGFAERKMHSISESLNTKLDREVKNVLTKQTSVEN